MARKKTKRSGKRRLAKQVPRRKNTRRAKQAPVVVDRNQAVKLVIADMRGDPSLSFTAATRKWKVDPRWVRKHFGSQLRKDSSGRIRAKVRSPRHKTLYKPTATPGVSIPVITKNKHERDLLGKWMAALNAAGRGDWSKMRKFPKGQVVGGIFLETDPKEVQAILRAMAEEESPYEGLYRTIVRPS